MLSVLHVVGCPVMVGLAAFLTWRRKVPMPDAAAYGAAVAAGLAFVLSGVEQLLELILLHGTHEFRCGNRILEVVLAPFGAACVDAFLSLAMNLGAGLLLGLAAWSRSRRWVGQPS